MIDEIDEEYEKPRNALLANSQRWFRRALFATLSETYRTWGRARCRYRAAAPLPKYLNPVQLRALPVTRPIFCTNRSESLHRSLGL